MGVETTRITSEALQASIRALLPSQIGFGDDLHATNLITPIIDLTATAEGSVLRSDLQTAIAFGNQTSFTTVNDTETLISNTGFYRVFGLMTCQTNTGSNRRARLELTDGTSTKLILDFQLFATNGPTDIVLPFDFNVFIGVGESLVAVSGSTKDHIGSTVRQLADISGTLVNPTGFTAE